MLCTTFNAPKMQFIRIFYVMMYREIERRDSIKSMRERERESEREREGERERERERE